MRIELRRIRIASIHCRAGAAAERAVTAPTALLARPPRRRVRWVAVGATVAAMCAVLIRAREQPVSAALTAHDSDGQLQIHWNSATGPVHTAETGTLRIVDGGAETRIPLDKLQLGSGSFDYVRHTGHVDVGLTLRQPSGKQVEQLTSLLGQPPAPKPGAPIRKRLPGYIWN